jgi:hypothetical protein
MGADCCAMFAWESLEGSDPRLIARVLKAGEVQKIDDGGGYALKPCWRQWRAEHVTEGKNARRWP